MTKPQRRLARRARGAAREGGILDRMLTDRAASPPAWPRATSGQACRSGVAAVAVEAFMNNVG